MSNWKRYERLKGDKESMAITFLKRSTLPAPIKGKEGTNSVSISENGQITLSSKLTAWLGEHRHVVMGYDAGTVYLFTPAAPLVKKGKVEEKDMISLRDNKKQKSVTFGGAVILRSADYFGDNIYDFKASGNQTFQAEVDDKNGCIKFALPKGAIARRPVVKRQKKVKTATVKAEAGNTNTVEVQAAEDELVIDAA